MKHSKYILLYVRSSVVLLMSVLLMLSCLAPYLAFDGNSVLYDFFKGICHQKNERCFYLFDHPQALCVRCTMIYLGMAVGAGFLPIYREENRKAYLMMLGISAALNGFDFLMEMINIYQNFFSTRIITGLLLGFPLGAFFSSAVYELFLTINIKALSNPSPLQR